MIRKLGTLCLSLMALGLPMPALAAPSKAEVEQQFRQWLSRDITPEAKKAGVSASTIDAALKGVSLKWDLPDLVPRAPRRRRNRIKPRPNFPHPAPIFPSNACKAWP